MGNDPLLLGGCLPIVVNREQWWPAIIPTIDMPLWRWHSLLTITEFLLTLLLFLLLNLFLLLEGAGGGRVEQDMADPACPTLPTFISWAVFLFFWQFNYYYIQLVTCLIPLWLVLLLTTVVCDPRWQASTLTNDYSARSITGRRGSVCCNGWTPHYYDCLPFCRHEHYDDSAVTNVITPLAMGGRILNHNLLLWLLAIHGKFWHSWWWTNFLTRPTTEAIPKWPGQTDDRPTPVRLTDYYIP